VRRPPRPIAHSAAPAVLLAAALAGCGGGGGGSAPAISAREAGAAIQLHSSAFAAGAPIPARYTCDGADVSPPLAWSGVPARAAQLALTVEDLDAAGHSFVHWAIGGLSPGLRALAEAAAPPGGVQGANDFGRRGYGGPCPPHGQRPHRYRFVIYALRQSLALAPGFRLSDRGTEIAKDTIAFGELVGTYRR
jgi:Raf kinase inhibitor-like YbhB/YbcL family protein